MNFQIPNSKLGSCASGLCLTTFDFRTLLVCTTLSVITFLSALSIALGADDSGLPQIENLTIGFANHYKLGSWTPIAVTHGGALGDSGASGQLEIEAPDGDGIPVRFVGPRTDWTLRETNTGFLQIGRAGTPNVLLRKSIGNRQFGEPERLPMAAGIKPPIAVPASNEFIVELGATLGLPELFRRQSERHTELATVVTVEGSQQLPNRWYGYEGVQLLAIAGVPAVDKKLLGKPAVDAIEEWVRVGGTLLIAAADQGERVFGKEAPLARFAPGEFDRTVNLRAQSIGAIENFAAAEEQEKLNLQALPAAQWKSASADKIELAAGFGQNRIPLVMRSSYGFGQVIVVGLDLYDINTKHKSPLSEWPARTKFLEKLLDRRALHAGESGGQENFGQGLRLGFTDISGQLRSALDQFAEAPLVPFWEVAAAALAYIAILFPLNYFIVHRWSKRQQVAWIVFPGAIVLFGALAYAWTQHEKGDQLHANQLDLVDIDTRDGRVRGTTWFNLFSPENTRFDLKLPSSFSGMQVGDGQQPGDPSDSLLCWLGLAGTGLGGMSSSGISTPLFDEAYAIDPPTGKIEGVPIGIWSSKSFIARFRSRGDGIEAKLSATDINAPLLGTLRNRLDGPLRDCVLFFGGYAYVIGNLEPGKTTALGQQLTALSVLTGRTELLANQQPPPYDRASVDPLKILQVMMFYNLAGARTIPV